MAKEEQLLNILKEFLNCFYDDTAHEFVSCVDLENEYCISKEKADLIKNWLESK